MSVNEKMTAIADAIRVKTGGTEPLGLDAMAQAIAALETGGKFGEYKIYSGSFVPSAETSSDYVVNTGIVDASSSATYHMNDSFYFIFSDPEAAISSSAMKPYEMLYAEKLQNIGNVAYPGSYGVNRTGVIYRTSSSTESTTSTNDRISLSKDSTTGEVLMTLKIKGFGYKLVANKRYTWVVVWREFRQ